MTSYGREPTFALYLAVLNKTDASPLLPESDEDPGVGTRAPENANKPPAAPPVVQIDFDRLQQRILRGAGCAVASIFAAEGGRDRDGVLPRSCRPRRVRAATCCIASA